MGTEFNHRNKSYTYTVSKRTRHRDALDICPPNKRS